MLAQVLVFALHLWAALYLLHTSTLLSWPRIFFVSHSGLPAWLLNKLYCSACVGTWVALGLFYLHLPPYAGSNWLDAMLAGTTLGALWGQYGPENAWFHENRYFLPGDPHDRETTVDGDVDVDERGDEHG